MEWKMWSNCEKQNYMLISWMESDVVYKDHSQDCLGR